MKPRYRYPAQSEPDALGGHDAYGFEWGPMSVVRLGHVAGRGYFLSIQTDHDGVQLFISEKGKKVRIVEYPENER